MLMNFAPKKIVVISLLLILVSTQYVLARHSISHLDSNNHSTQRSTEDNENSSDICQTCVTTKNLSQKFLLETSYFFKLSKPGYLIFCLPGFVGFQSLNKPFRSQAPPILFF